MESLATGSGLIRVNGYRLYHETCGTPEKGTLLVLHGGPGISHDYLHPLADISQFGYRVVLYDQLGVADPSAPKTRVPTTSEGPSMRWKASGRF
jgi:proline iminopeptidase